MTSKTIKNTLCILTIASSAMISMAANAGSLNSIGIVQNYYNQLDQSYYNQLDQSYYNQYDSPYLDMYFGNEMFQGVQRIGNGSYRFTYATTGGLYGYGDVFELSFPGRFLKNGIVRVRHHLYRHGRGYRIVNKTCRYSFDRFGRIQIIGY